MNEFSPQLKRFARRVRIVRAWRGLAVGACLASAAAAAWTGADMAGLYYVEVPVLIALVGAGAALGALVNGLRPVPRRALTASIERRAGLEERLSTADERERTDDVFDSALREDAVSRLATVHPKTVYPLRLDRWHAGTLGLVAATAALFLLGNTPLLLDAKAKANREAVQREGQRVERVRKENLNSQEGKLEMSEAERRLADQMRRLQRDLEKARMSPEEARQKANELGKQADELMKQKAEQTLQSLNDAESALEKLQGQQDRLALPGGEMPMNGMSPMDRKSAMEKAKAKLAEAKRRAEDLEKQLAELRKKLENGALSDAERKALEAQKRALEASKKEAEAAQRDAAQQIQDLQLSPEAEAVFRKMREHPLYKELQEMAAKMKADAKGAAGGKRPQLTKEEIEAMRRKLEEFAKAMQDEKALEAYLQALKEAMESGASMGRCNGVCMGLGGIPLPGAGGPGADDDSMVFDSGKVNQLEQGRKGAGKTQTTGVRGLMRETPEEDPYIEIKAPATVGNRSSVPYVQVLPSYRKKAESALDRQQIPKEHQKRVREYFNSLGK